MDRILHTIDIKERLKYELSKTNNSLIVISAYVKLDALKFIDKQIQSILAKKSILVRFRYQDILNGSSDLEIFHYAKENNWKIYLDFDLHSKIIVFDSQRIILGSANMTSSGIGLGKNQNIESVACLDISDDELRKIQMLISNSKELDEIMFEQMVLEINSSKNILQDQTWSNKITNYFHHNIRYLWTTEMLFSSSPDNICEHDIELLGLDKIYSFEDVKKAFLKSKPYLWLKIMVVNEMYFGELTAILHESLMDDPKPYRRDVKNLLSDLLNWVQDLQLEDIIIDRPNYSQRIRIFS